MWLNILIIVIIVLSLSTLFQNSNVEGYRNELAYTDCLYNPERFGRDRFAYDCLYGPFEKRSGCTDCYGLSDPRTLCYGKTKGAQEVAQATIVAQRSACWSRGRLCQQPFGTCGI